MDMDTLLHIMVMDIPMDIVDMDIMVIQDIIILDTIILGITMEDTDIGITTITGIAIITIRIDVVKARGSKYQNLEPFFH